jgi:5-methylcytosine-specific restriction endonuclease McrA
MSRKKPPQQIIAEPIGLDLPLLPPRRKRKTKIDPKLRAKILERDGYACRYCGCEEDLTIDHVVPRSKGGKNHSKNMVTACRPCNETKADQTWQPRPLPKCA